MAFTDKTTMAALLRTLPQRGEVVWIGIRPERNQSLVSLDAVEAITDQKLAGDHYKGNPGSNRQVTLIQAEHLAAVASFLHRAGVDPGLVRRNIVVKGLNLLALKDKRFYAGEALLEMTGLCHPCSRMEEALGEGGYNAMRGHGGITARIIRGGTIRVGDGVAIEIPG